MRLRETSAGASATPRLLELRSVVLERVWTPWQLQLRGVATLQNAVLAVAAVLIVLCCVTLTRADPDLWGHVRFGQDMIAAGSVRVPDTYSFTSDRPWINHEWLAEIVMAAAYERGGAAGLVLLKLVVIGLTLASIWHIVRRDGGGTRAAVFLCSLALAGILYRAQMVRPQLFSVLWFAVLMVMLRRADRHPHFLWIGPPLFAVWANMHGGWLVGAGTFVVWCSINTLTGAASSTRRLLLMWAACGLSIAATLATPYGLGLWVFLNETVGTSRRFIAEWGPVTGAPNLLIVWLGFWALIALALRRASGAPTFRSAVLPAFWGILSFKVSRLDAFFALSTIAFLTPALLTVLQRRASRPTGQPSLVRLTAICVVGMLACAAAASQLAKNVSCIDVHASTMPEPEAIAFIRNRQLSGRMATYFDWGQYIIWHKPEGLRVSMDGRRETVYSDAAVDAHLDLYLGTAQGYAYLEALQADYVWVPNQLPVAGDLLKSAAWRPIYQGAQSVIFARSGIVQSTGPIENRAAVECRCFPGP